MAKQSSIAAYNALCSSGRGSTQRAKVLYAILSSNIGMTRQELSKQLSLPINAICGRVKELLDDEMIRVSKHHVYCAVTNNKVEALFSIRDDEA